MRFVSGQDKWIKGKMKKVSLTPPKTRLSFKQRWQVGLDCQDLAFQQIEKLGKRKLRQVSKFSRTIEDKTKALEKRLADGRPRHKAVAVHNRRQAILEHKKQLAKTKRADTKLFYKFRLRPYKEGIIDEVSSKWHSLGYQASPMTVRRCWEELDALQDRLRRDTKI